MKLVLARIDDRLVHGQVVLGCCPALGASRVLVCSDEVAADPLLARVYAAAAPPGIQVEILDRAAARARLTMPTTAGDDERAILVTATVGDLRWLVEQGLDVAGVNVGGLHPRPGARELWPGFFLTASDQADLRALLLHHVRVQVQTVPGADLVEASLEQLDSAGGEP